MEHAQRVVLQKTDFRDAHRPPASPKPFGVLKPFNKNEINNTSTKRRPDPLLSRYNSRDSPTKRLQTHESSGPIEIQQPSRTPTAQRALLYENTTENNHSNRITSPNPALQVVDQNQPYSTPTKLYALNSSPRYDINNKRPREEEQAVQDQPPSKIQRTTYAHVTHSTIRPISSSPPNNNENNNNNAPTLPTAPAAQRSPASVPPHQPTISPVNQNYRSMSQPVLPVSSTTHESSTPPTQPSPAVDPEPHSFSQPTPVTRSGSASGNIMSSQQSTQGYTPNTTPYSSQSSQVTVSINGSSSQPNVDEVQSLKIEISKLKAMLRKANNDFKKMAEESANNAASANPQPQQDSSSVLIQEIDQLKNEIELLKQQKEEAVQQAAEANNNNSLVPLNTHGTQVIPANDSAQFHTHGGYYNNYGPNAGAIEKLQHTNMYLLSKLETVQAEREKEVAKLKRVENEVDMLSKKNGDLTQCLDRTEKARKSERQTRKQKEAEALTLKQQVEALAQKLEHEEALRKKQEQEALAKPIASAIPSPVNANPVPAVELDMTIMNDKQLEKCFLRMYLELKRRREANGPNTANDPIMPISPQASHNYPPSGHQ